MQKEIFIAGGCFWGVERYFQKVKGVLDTKACYINGGFEGVKYKEVCEGSSHVEAVRVIYDNSKITEEDLWKLYLRIINPYSLNKQGNDRGVQYRIGLYSYDKDLLKKFSDLNEAFMKSEGKKNYIEIQKVEDVTLAEEYHQNYLLKNVNGYCHINLDDIPEEYQKQ
ncbi:peptide-methionine (S)-S-oxide reductase MsrA [Mycoplasmopsis pulmonis]|uniref:Peptide methionine sulfoxide reductase MsrA n=1 Tax=Mycoplasmopsis pulmonis (strain UAB CTIP) TaxID=272635 RepID=MSRA_MYCPU|nr:peptide-methionine (S)-S-oxide reductase MsrA [Mycoplasmopsis pulmonis]Q98PE5.2 RecName: Full=Peptide methionine sulfoxide reductase MsrA; Short=Protein-methionine-S-oxide reductase; AltName: Full=Peptide-methionine (S)-S-oxide reductase; Short=Peptide Met(O) reductase [Mycoplasmopsis pulmonis UAB CTIP]MDZ7293380.1 peptide-methionine (S)-S-oxide reductase MsrA [Mycoplasmopsis pulmonis]VEU68539.1 peptide methionine sulfoxide reductase MsrA [Mycoplasmopsis pulmonis]